MEPASPSRDDLPAGYPAMWETHAVLADGTTVELRPVRPSDRDLIDVFHRRQSPESIYFRFFQHRPELSQKELDYFTRVDYADRMAFVALIGGDLVAVARYESGMDADRPEVAFFVDDAHHGKGLATLLLEYLAAAARSRGVRGFTASVLPENHAMLRVFRRAGFGVRTRFEEGVIEVDMDITLTPGITDAVAERQSRARSRSVARLLRPASVAVVGASRQPGSVGHELVRSLLHGGFTGRLIPVNPAADALLGLPCLPSLAAVDQPVDLVIVAVPAPAVEAVVEEAVAAGAGGALVVSSGFSDVGSAGAERERRLVALARSNGMRLVGPNAFGMVNTDPAVQLRALFLPIAPQSGPVGILSESGPLGGAVLDLMARAGIGISSFVAPGNRADVSVNDLLDYWTLDDATSVVLLYVENYGNLRNFARSARSLARRKPVVAVRPPDDDLADLLARSGVITTDGVAQLADMARVVATETLPGGRRVAVVANAASVARLASAACRRHGLEVVVPDGVPLPGLGSARPVPANLSGGSRGGTDTVLVPDPALVADPVLVGDSVLEGDSVLVGDVDVVVPDGAQQRPDYAQLLVSVAASAQVDAVLVALVPSLDLSLEALAEVLDGVNRSIPKPLVAAGLVDPDRLAVPGLPLFTFPEEAARCLGLLADYAEWRRRQDQDAASADGAGDGSASAAREAAVEAAVAPVVASVLDDRHHLTLNLWSPDTAAVLEAVGVSPVPWRLARSVDEAVAAAAAIGYPVVLKAAGDGPRSVGEAGGTAIDLFDEDRLRNAYARMLDDRGEAMLPVVVQAMVPSAANVKLDVVQDPVRGALVSIGVGGAAGRNLPPVARRHLPLLQGEVGELVDELAGAVPLDQASRLVVAGLVEHLTVLAAAVPELARLCLDPVLVAGPATAPAEAVVELRACPPDPLAEVRRL